MAKVGIVTQPLMGNYGGLLQNYALQTVLRHLGHEPVTFDYQPGFTGWSFAKAQSRRIVGKFLGRGGKWLVPYAPRRQNPDIVKFIDENIRITSMFWNRYKPSLIERYGIDAVVVGSDQVWRPRFNQCLADMYLDFAKNMTIRRVAYAASFGTAEWEYKPRQVCTCSRLLQHFDAVSVREQSGIELARRLGSAAEWVLDPTLLLGREGFDKLLDRYPTEKSEPPYLATYILDPCGYLDSITGCIRSKMGLEMAKNMGENTTGMGPVEWIHAISRAGLLLTDSFHGTVFALLYHVPFITILNSDRGADRFHSLLRPLGLSDRLVTSLEEITNYERIEAPIDWSTVDSLLTAQRATSIAFLSSALKL